MSDNNDSGVEMDVTEKTVKGKKKLKKTTPLHKSIEHRCIRFETRICKVTRLKYGDTTSSLYSHNAVLPQIALKHALAIIGQLRDCMNLLNFSRVNASEQNASLLANDDCNELSRNELFAYLQNFKDDNSILLFRDEHFYIHHQLLCSLITRASFNPILTAAENDIKAFLSRNHYGRLTCTIPPLASLLQNKRYVNLVNTFICLLTDDDAQHNSDCENLRIRYGVVEKASGDEEVTEGAAVDINKEESTTNNGNDSHDGEPKQQQEKDQQTQEDNNTK